LLFLDAGLESPALDDGPIERGHNSTAHELADHMLSTVPVDLHLMPDALKQQGEVRRAERESCDRCLQHQCSVQTPWWVCSIHHW
jgi:hypothetical protein